MQIQQGDFVEVRGRPWLVEAIDDSEHDLTTLRLSCIADDAQGEQIEVIWDAEIGARVLEEDAWSRVGRGAPDSPEVLAAHLRAVRWRSATAAERDLLQAPFRAGIKLDAYQLLPLRKALRLPRVNLLIADDVGLGKTIEAGLIMRELLLRRRIDFIVVAAPASMTVQWKDELAERFEHRLFLTATPHNGHSNSFTALLEMLDPQRFTRGVKIVERQLEPVMVRRLKADLRRLGEAFPERIVEAIPIRDLPPDA